MACAALHSRNTARADAFASRAEIIVAATPTLVATSPHAGPSGSAWAMRMALHPTTAPATREGSKSLYSHGTWPPGRNFACAIGIHAITNSQFTHANVQAVRTTSPEDAAHAISGNWMHA